LADEDVDVDAVKPPDICLNRRIDNYRVAMYCILRCSQKYISVCHVQVTVNYRLHIFCLIRWLMNPLLQIMYVLHVPMFILISTCLC